MKKLYILAAIAIATVSCNGRKQNDTQNDCKYTITVLDYIKAENNDMQTVFTVIPKWVADNDIPAKPTMIDGVEIYHRNRRKPVEGDTFTMKIEEEFNEYTVTGIKTQNYEGQTQDGENYSGPVYVITAKKGKNIEIGKTPEELIEILEKAQKEAEE